jgi:putative ABC transport system permease protein
MARVHNFNARDERAVSIYDWNRFRTLVTSISTGLRLLMLIIGTLTLSIGAVGVMNIMLVSVTERTREIGILKSLGARRWHILLQVLIEGVAITVTGGLIGLLLAFAVVKAIGTLPLLGPLFEDTTGRGDIHLQVSLAVVAVSVSVLVGIGLVAALIPAVRAARLDPVQAIRGE